MGSVAIGNIGAQGARGLSDGIATTAHGYHRSASPSPERSRRVETADPLQASATRPCRDACGTRAHRRLHRAHPDATVEARRQASERGLVLVHPYDDWTIVAGQASVGLELLADLPEANVVVVPLGGGGLLAGIALAIKLQRPDVRIVGVQAEAVAPWRHFLDDGGIEPVAHGRRTIADGISVKAPGELTRQVIARHVDAIVTVDDNAIAEAIVTLLERTRTIGEGAGVVALAALLQRRIEVGPDDRVACVVSGGNIDMGLVGRSIDYGLAASGRLLNVAVTLPDTPGRLSGLLQTVAALGINVREVHHGRGELQVPVGMTEITLALETRDRAHQRELLDRLAGEGLVTRWQGAWHA